MTAKGTGAVRSPEAQLRYLIEAYGPKDKKFIRSVLAAVQKRVPTANQLLYEYRDFFVINYSPTEHPAQGILTISAREDGIRLYFTQLEPLPDPKKLLKGTAKQVRYVDVESAKKVSHPDIEALIAAAIAQAKVPYPPEGGGQVIIRTAKKPDGTPRAKAKKAKKAKKTNKAKNAKKAK